MSRILGISGSLRAGSFNTLLLKAAVPLLADGDELSIATLHDIPLYDGDLEEANGLPASVVALKQRITESDGVLLASPEYNNGIPGVFKNAIDWLSRPAADIPQVFGNRAFAVIGASPSGFGTIMAQNAWLPILRALGARPWTGGRLLVSKAHQVFDPAGEIKDAAIREQLGKFVTGFAGFAGG